ncbi:DUF1697 domain-containing protein [Microbacterium sp. SORGH_AS_0888]|uniref:DUF1697 domain-containing protein n=1 Tax=Microbacterium sp. SORGH_AS_0888 TaxID=3041791 RepID=UPI00278648B3|nr:DUF1697 domain-containing protein [Microbacterium sp. SORGH_AS_0888]MDQ1128549.1 uncharacterized protein (DUF1697 family) [Microbacterium sp. SORGH_AS_0888]
MTAWVALLRGVNVNGITIRNTDLALLFTDLGLASVTPVLASGNVRFRTADPPEAADDERRGLKTRIENALRERFAYEAWIVLVTLAELRSVVEGFPFDREDASRQPYVVFCGDGDALAELTAAADGLDPAEDPLRAASGVLYWNPEKGRTPDTPFGRILGRARWKATTTTRNLRTLAKILTAS